MSKSENPYYSLRQVIDLTGVSEFTLRGWETRHQALLPRRSKTGRRQYDKTDILKIRLLMDLLKHGHRIGKIARLDEADLVALTNSAVVNEISPPQSMIPREVVAILTFIGQFEWDKIQTLFIKLRKSHGPRKFIFDFLLPLIAEMNSLCEKKQLGIAQEHIMSALIKESLYQVVSVGLKKHKRKSRIVLATPEGDFHEIGVLVASAILAVKGIRQLYLGPNVPKADLCEASLRFGATHVVVSSTYSKGSGAKDELFQYIHFLDRNLDPNIQLLLGGINVFSHPLKLQREHKLLGSFSEFDALLF
ncbi:MAG: MerR family transcriptional regulator [Bdellovibrionaceae bacterium]|nr:MerR family transcriptional regulator [Pseudobdellovibrionaceae bacterium]